MPISLSVTLYVTVVGRCVASMENVALASLSVLLAIEPMSPNNKNTHVSTIFTQNL